MTRSVVPRELLAALAAEWSPAASGKIARTTPPEQRPQPSDAGARKGRWLRVGDWLAARGREYRVKPRPEGKGRTVYVLAVCPFNKDHHDDACIMQSPSGALSAKCLHDGCVGNGYKAFRDKIGKPDPEHWDVPEGQRRPGRVKGKKREAAGPACRPDAPAGGPPTRPDDPAGPPDADGEARVPRPEIRHNRRQLRDVVADAAAALAGHNRPPTCFDRGGMVRVHEDAVRGLVIEEMSQHAVRLKLSEAADWFVVRSTSDGDVTEDDAPSMEAVNGLMSLPAWPGVPPLAGVATVPLYTAAAEMLSAPGYDPASAYYFRPDPGLDSLHVPADPTADEVAAALAVALEPFEEFPFADDASRAAALGMMLEPFVRQMIDGPCPLWLVDAPTEGTGKTLLVQTAMAPAFGRGFEPLQEVDDVEEWRKTLFSSLIENPGLVFIDNVNKKLDSGPLAAAITATRLKQRILGASRVGVVEVRCTWVATGNNVRMSREMLRRTVPLRLLPTSENPSGSGQMYKRELPQWALAHRPRLVAACLTLVRAWVCAACPAGPRTVGKFEAWAKVIGGILDVAGVPGFLDNLTTYRETAIDEGTEWKCFVEAWWGKYQGGTVGCTELYELAAELEMFGAVPDVVGFGGMKNTRANHGSKVRFGGILKKNRDRVVGVHRITFTGTDHRNVQRYRLAQTRGAAAGPVTLPAQRADQGITVTDDGDTVEFVA